MGKFLLFSEIPATHLVWYFSSVEYYGYDRRSISLDKDYPYKLYIHATAKNKLILVRELIEYQGSSTVIADTLDLDYIIPHYSLDPLKSGNHIHHRYWQLSFRSQDDCALVKLQFANIAESEPKPFEPENHDYHAELIGKNLLNAIEKNRSTYNVGVSKKFETTIDEYGKISYKFIVNTKKSLAVS